MTRKKKPALAGSIAPEDIRRGLHVSILHVIDQYPSFCFDLPGRPELISIRAVPECLSEPLEVIDVCLPFMTVRRPSRAIITLDVRRFELALLDDAYARRVIRLLRAQQGSD